MARSVTDTWEAWLPTAIHLLKHNAAGTHEAELKRMAREADSAQALLESLDMLWNEIPLNERLSWKSYQCLMMARRKAKGE